MPLDMPCRLGPFMVDDQGGLLPPADRDARFTLRWRGCAVRAAMRPLGGGAGPGRVELTLQATLGRVPSSAEASAGRREEVLAALRGGGEGAPLSLRCGLSADHRAVLHGREELALPVTSRALVARVACFLLEAAPYLDLVAEAGATPVGSANTWPG